MYAGRGCGRGNTDADEKGLLNDLESHAERAIDELRSKTDQQERGMSASVRLPISSRGIDEMSNISQTFAGDQDQKRNAAVTP